MSITLIGFFLIPLSLFIFVFRPDFLVPWAIIVSAFQAASVINFGGGFAIGISPYFFVATLVAIRFAFTWIKGSLSFKRGDVALEITGPLLMLATWGVVSAIFLPFLFAGVHVDTPRLGMDPVSTTPLEWSMSNAAQAGYLLLNSAFLIYVLWQSNEAKRIERLSWAFVWAGAIASAVGAYQLAAHVLGLPFPAEIFNSNAGWQQLVSQRVAGAWRVSATFNEPSSAGIFFAAWTAYLLFLVRDQRSATGVLWFLFWCGIVMLLLTTSTTGYVTASVLIGLVGFTELRSLAGKGYLSGKLMLTFAAIVVVVVAFAFLMPDFKQLIADIIWYKGQSHSGQERASTILVALDVTMESWGLGVGLGSNRPSGMLFYILSNIGLPGSILIVYLLFATRRVVTRALSMPVAAGVYVRSATWASAMYCVAMCVSGADISSPHLWILWSMVLGFTRFSLQVPRLIPTREIDTGTIGSRQRKIVLLTPEFRVG
jgi:hypothetical protein